MIETIGGMTAVVIRTEEAEEIGAIVIVIRGLSMKRKRSSKLAEGQQEVIEVTTEVTPEVLPEAVNWSVAAAMILHPLLKKLNEIFRPEVEPMYGGAKKRIVAHRGALSHMAEVDMTMILMMILLERKIRDVRHPSKLNWQFVDMQQEIAVETTRHLMSRARLNPDGNQNAESHWENKHSRPWE